MAMTRKDIAMNIQTETGLPKMTCSKIVDSIFEIMKDELANGNQVKIPGFGQWNVLNKRARAGRDPQTGKAITIAARKVVTFKTSEVMRKSMNSRD